MDNSFEMLSPFPHTFAADFTGDLPQHGSFTALLTAEDDDVFFDDILDQKPLFLPSVPHPETLESLIPPSVLSSGFSNGYQRIPSFPHSGEKIYPRKRALEDTPFPNLHSPDIFPQATVMPTQKLPRVEVQPPFSPPTLESILNGFSLSDFVAAVMDKPEINDVAQNSSRKADKGKTKKDRDVAKDRRHKISEKIRCLGKLLPYSDQKKMNTATLLEEAHAYIRFLQAQVNALNSMPARSAYDNVPTAQLSSGPDGILRSLNRQQLLQVVVNSPAAQAVLSSEKCCVVSAEQVSMLKKVLSERLSAAGF